MKVLLVQPPLTILRTETKKCHPPLGLAYLAAILKDCFEVKVLDALAEGYEKVEPKDGNYLRIGLSFLEIEKKIIEFLPDVVGVSCLFSAQAENVYEICRIIKKIKGRIITVIGGAHPSAVFEDVLQRSEVDFVVIGEGETIFKQLLECIKNKNNIRNVEGLGFKDKEGIKINPRKGYQEDLDNFVFPYWDIFPLEKYFKINNPHGGPARKVPFLPVITSRGCPFECIFCSIHNLWGRGYRKRSAENILEELKYLKDKYGIKEVLFEDDNLTLDKERAKEIFQGMIDSKLNLSWSVPNGIAIQTLDDEMLELMKKSGCYSISVGIESGDEDVLKNIIKKPIELQQVMPVVRKARNLRMETSAFFVVGLPGESEEQLKKTFRFAESIHADNINFFFATPLPGTRLEKLCKEKGLLDNQLESNRLKSDEPCFSTCRMTKKQLQYVVNRERLKLSLLSLLRNPGRFLYKVMQKLLKDPAYFLRFESNYIINKAMFSGRMEKENRTKRVYDYLWMEVQKGRVEKWHFDEMQNVIPESIVRGAKGIDVGSGCGYDTFLMAKNNPSVKIASLDISDGVYKTKELVSGLSNAWVLKGSALNIPIADNTFDFAYSYGVLHHTLNPDCGIKEIARVIKKDSPVFLYLYEDHSENHIKYLSLKIVNVLRKITTRIPSKALFIFSFLLSPFVMILFTYPSRIFKKFKTTRSFSEKVPFNFGTHLFSLSGDLYDRLGAPIERRFSRKQVVDLLERNGFVNIGIDRMKGIAGWVAWGFLDK